MSNTQDFKDNEGSSSTSDTSNSAYKSKESSTNPFTRRQLIVGGGSLAGVAAAGIASRGQAQAQPPQENNKMKKLGQEGFRVKLLSSLGQLVHLVRSKTYCPSRCWSRKTLQTVFSTLSRMQHGTLLE